MKKITILLLIASLTFIFSCESDEVTPQTTYKLVKIESFNPDDELEETTAFEYNEDGSIDRVNVDGEDINFIYSNGKVVTIDSNDPINYTYDGDLIISSSEESGSETYITTYTYNSNNQVISQISSQVGSTTEYEATYTYDANDNVLTETTSTSSYVYTYTYDSQKNPARLILPEALLKINSIGQNNVLTEGLSDSYTYEYNGNGYPTKESYFYNGELEEYSLYTYEEI